MLNLVERLVEFVSGLSESVKGAVSATMLMFVCDLGLVTNAVAGIARFVAT